MHKLHTLKFDVRTIRSGIGSAFLPPIPKDDLVAIGRTNDSILYGGEVFLWVDTTDEAIEAVGPKLPSSASNDYGTSFLEIFHRYGGDFYKIDPMLFSPAMVTINNLATGSIFEFGKTEPGWLPARSSPRVDGDPFVTRGLIGVRMRVGDVESGIPTR